jgi:long-chain acyl-CoA synthetase
MNEEQLRWLKWYPRNVKRQIHPEEYPTIVDLLDFSFKKYGKDVAFVNKGTEMTYEELDKKSHAFAAYLQNKGLKPGDKIAIMMPNLL